MVYSDQNPYKMALGLMEAMRDLQFSIGNLTGFCEWQTKVLNMRRKADLHEELVRLSRPIEWEGGR